MSTLLNLPESYEFKCTNESRVRTFRYPDRTTIEISNVEYQAGDSDEHSINLIDKRVSVLIGKINDSKKKGSKYCGTLTNYDEDVSIQIVFLDKEFRELVVSLENISNTNNLYIDLDINGKEAKKKKSDYTTYLIENAKIVRLIKWLI